ncbi:MAG: hypothetical protein JWL92_622 [Candidatus Nomurabacteria bacterium]|nr:hypothetical protein [Candidatus Nomurabacteria bacterium]
MKKTSIIKEKINDDRWEIIGDFTMMPEGGVSAKELSQRIKKAIENEKTTK